MTTTTEATTLKISREYKIGRNDDEGVAATIGNLTECECCGRKIARVTVLSNGLKVGSECATYLTRPDLRQDDESIKFYLGRRNKKADAYLAANNYK